MQGLPNERKLIRCVFWVSLSLFYERHGFIDLVRWHFFIRVFNTNMEEVEEKEDKPNFFRRMSVRLSKRNKKKSTGKFEEITK